MQGIARKIFGFAGHLFFWVLSLWVLMMIFNVSGSLQMIDFVYVVVFHFSLLPLFYLNFLLITPVFFLRKKYFLFMLALSALVFIFALVSEMLFNQYADYIFPGFYFVSTFSLRESVLVHALYIVISTLIVLSGSWFREAETREKIIGLEKEKLHAELQMLQNQVNPHFFFNTLQSLYALALKKADDLPDMILNLSDMMRYVIYESDVGKIKIAREIAFIKSYLELQKLRMTKDADLLFEVKGDDDVEIPPLILIFFIENCFKHGLKSEIKNAYAHIYLEYDDKQLVFKSSNNKRAGNEKHDTDKGGSGIQNVKRRLDLHYPGNYELEINNRESSFEIRLKINLL